MIAGHPNFDRAARGHGANDVDHGRPGLGVSNGNWPHAASGTSSLHIFQRDTGPVERSQNFGMGTKQSEHNDGEYGDRDRLRNDENDQSSALF